MKVWGFFYAAFFFLITKNICQKGGVLHVVQRAADVLLLLQEKYLKPLIIDFENPV